MYTKEDFWRDYPPKEQPFAFPWEAEYHRQVLAKTVAQAARVAYETGREKGREEERKAVAHIMRDLGLDHELITRVTGLTAVEIAAL